VSVEENGMMVLDPVPHPAIGHTPPNRYSDDIRTEAVRLSVEEGKTIAAISREMEIPPDTIAGMLQEVEQYIQLEEKARGLRLVGKVGQCMEELLDGLTKNLEKAYPKDIAMAFGVLADKRRDLLGPRAGPGALSLKIAWKDGTGAVELKTGVQE